MWFDTTNGYMEKIKMKSQRTILNDVMIMRPIVIFLLIVTHSFTMYTGGSWSLPEGINEVYAYGEIAHIAFSFMLETFVFISGYLFAMQQQRQQKPFTFFLLKKLQRLVVPGIIFSTAYIACFDSEIFKSGGVILEILNGTGHLWFLPMLFCCFIMAYGINTIKGHDNFKFALCFIMSLCSGLLPLSVFRINSACYYILFFYLGMYLYPRRQKIIAKLNLLNVMAFIVLFVVSYIFFSHEKQILSESEMSTIMGKLLRVLGMKMCTMVYSSMGLVMIYVISNYIIKCKNKWQCPLWLISINSICFGVYIYQQFILKFIYYSTPLPQWTGTYFLPWVGCVITMITSIALAKLTTKSKIGRKLIK